MMSYKVDVFNMHGEKLRERQLNDVIFNDDNINDSLIHEFVLLQLANARHPIAHTKTRGEVALSGRKLYRQKGTGRARVGDAGSPIRRHGGVAFGPRNIVNYQKDMPKGMRKKALLGALSIKARDNEIICLDKYESDDVKTKNAIKTLNNVGLVGQKILLVLHSLDKNYILPFRNVEKLKYILVDYINPYDLLVYKKVLFLESALDKLEQRFAS